MQLIPFSYILMGNAPAGEGQACILKMEKLVHFSAFYTRPRTLKRQNKALS